MLMEKVSGALVGDVFDAPSREAVLDSARVLARLHQIAPDEIVPTLRESMNRAPTASELRAHVTELQQLWQTHSRAHSVTMDAVFAWLQANVDQLRPLVTVVHGDYSYHNLLFVGDELSAVMDWELVHIGHPAEDVGYIRGAVLTQVPWPDFMAAYREAGGPELEERDVIFYALLGKLRLIALLFRARQYFESGQTDDLQIADVCVFHMTRLVHQCSMEMRTLPRRW